MPHPASYRAALRAVLGVAITTVAVLLPGVAPAAETPSGAPTTDPLLVHIDTITPVLRPRGTVDVTGTVTNTTDAQFTRVNLHAVSSVFPIVEAAALVDSAATPADGYIGERETDPGTFDTVDVLLPGATAPFSLSVPVELLDASGEPGVYWFGVQALGDSPQGRDTLADGRVRTFLPTRPRGDEGLEAAVILPLRSRVWYQPDGSLGGTERWLRWLSEGGRLDTALDIADAAAGDAYTWLVDPAILTAAARLAEGNPPRSLAPDPAVPQEPAEQGPEEQPTDGGSPATSGQTLTPPRASTAEEDEKEPSQEELALASAAASWLERFRAATVGRPVLALPFGDLDVSAAVRNRPERFEQALTRTAQVMTELDIPFQPALAPENDVLSSEALLATPQGTTILMGDTAFAPPPITANSTVRLLGHRVVVTSSGAQSGGPAPTPADDPVAMRQRLLSEAALRVGSGSTAPVVVTLPSGWSPEDAGALFSAFDEPWLESVSVTDVADRSASGLPGRALAYTEEDVAGELDAANFLAADRLSHAATLMEEVLTLQTAVEQQVRDEALVTLSQQHRERPRMAQRSAGAAREHLVDQLASIRIEPIREVILSSDSGRLGGTLVNGLDQPVSVSVDATSDGGMSLVGPDVRELAPQARSLVLFRATAERPGVHNVRLAVTSASGTALGSSARFPIRAAQVSGLIWVVMAAGAALLLGAAALRLWREVRARRTEDDDPSDASQAPPTVRRGATA